MGFVNINSKQIHTSALNGMTFSSGTWSTTTITSGGSYSYYTIAPARTIYHILGEDVEVEGYRDVTVSMLIATINILGKPYYDELKKQRIYLQKDIEDFLDKKFIILERDRKIESVINDRTNEK